MSNKKEAAPSGDMIDPHATAPSKDPNRDENAKSTATEPNSKQRIGTKVKRTGRNNGGDGERRGATGLNKDFTADTLGERDAVPAAETDVIWTNASKDRWGADQPDMAKLLDQRNKINQPQNEDTK